MKISPDAVSVRNLESIQEDDIKRRAPKLGTAILVALGAGALVTATAMSLGRSTKTEENKRDPLAELAQKAKAAAPPAQAEEIVAPSQATFATRLSDQAQPTTALAAVKDDRGDLVPLRADAPAAPVPPSAVDRLPVVPLPAGNLLQATSVTTAPGDELTTLAVEKSRPELGDTSNLAGTEGGYQIQVASFRDQAEADAFVAELKKRGHKSYRQAAYVPDRGLWHRVRIGPFKQKFEAVQYQAGFEQKEHMSTFLVDPEKVAREQQERAARVAARED